jgi:hypothetical protein
MNVRNPALADKISSRARRGCFSASGGNADQGVRSRSWAAAIARRASADFIILPDNSKLTFIEPFAPMLLLHQSKMYPCDPLLSIWPQIVPRMNKIIVIKIFIFPAKTAPESKGIGQGRMGTNGIRATCYTCKKILQ